MTHSPEAQTLVDAIALLRVRADSANHTLWTTARPAASSVAADPDAAFIALMSPQVAEATADFLATILKTDAEHSIGLNWNQQVPGHALDIAQAVIGGARRG